MNNHATIYKQRQASIDKSQLLAEENLRGAQTEAQESSYDPLVNMKA